MVIFAYSGKLCIMAKTYSLLMVENEEKKIYTNLSKYYLEGCLLFHVLYHTMAAIVSTLKTYINTHKHIDH